MKKILPLVDIIRDPGLQTRVTLDASTAQDYCDAMGVEGATFPPITVFETEGKFLLADGFHRLRAAELAGHTKIDADVQMGGRSDALKFALQSNSAHGLQRNNADKHRAVELALAEWPALSDRELARLCGVSNNFVGTKRQVSSDDTSTGTEYRTGRDGKSYPASGGYKGPSSFRKWGEPHVDDAPSEDAPEKSKTFGGLRPDEFERNGETILAAQDITNAATVDTESTVMGSLPEPPTGTAPAKPRSGEHVWTIEKFKTAIQTIRSEFMDEWGDREDFLRLGSIFMRGQAVKLEKRITHIRRKKQHANN